MDLLQLGKLEKRIDTKYKQKMKQKRSSRLQSMIGGWLDVHPQAVSPLTINLKNIQQHARYNVLFKCLEYLITLIRPS